ncbi:MAG: hypothetical protein OEL76_00335 [Siculibacillus sp.]|nr:hypothetical protein [Siculibacillus sp.]
MSDVERTDLLTLAAPYRREVRLEHVVFESDMKMLRVIVREGHRITQLDLDPETARLWGAAMVDWADRIDRGDPATP